jgi:DNA replication licensing factor MCM5
MHCGPKDKSPFVLLMLGGILSQVRRVAAEGSGELPAVPITVRQLEAIIRLAESLARMSLVSEASEDHVREAIRLFKHSTMDAVKSGAQTKST